MMNEAKISSIFIFTLSFHKANRQPNTKLKHKNCLSMSLGWIHVNMNLLPINASIIIPIPINVANLRFLKIPKTNKQSNNAYE